MARTPIALSASAACIPECNGEILLGTCGGFTRRCRLNPASSAIQSLAGAGATAVCARARDGIESERKFGIELSQASILFDRLAVDTVFLR